MKFITIGINHKTAPIEIREKFFLTEIEQDLLLTELKCNPAIIEAFVLSTCNRTEIHAHVLDQANYFPTFLKLLSDIKKVPFERKMSQLFYVHTDLQAIDHLFAVTAGLDSLVLGEKQILGQVRKAMLKAQERGMFSKYFNILVNLTLRTGKKARHETDISSGGSSVSWAAITLAEKLLGSLKGRSILLIGAGKMGELTVQQLHQKELKTIYIMNRTQEIAEDFARRYGGQAVGFCDIKEVLSSVDLCICSSGAPHYVIDKGIIDKIYPMREGRKLTLLDISMPRNVDPAVKESPLVHLSDIDDLHEVLGESLRKREAAVKQVKTIIEKNVKAFIKKIDQSFPEEKVVSETVPIA